MISQKNRKENVLSEATRSNMEIMNRLIIATRKFLPVLVPWCSI